MKGRASKGETAGRREKAKLGPRTGSNAWVTGVEEKPRSLSESMLGGGGRWG